MGFAICLGIGGCDVGAGLSHWVAEVTPSCGFWSAIGAHLTLVSILG